MRALLFPVLMAIACVSYAANGPQAADKAPGQDPAAASAEPSHHHRHHHRHHHHRHHHHHAHHHVMLEPGYDYEHRGDPRYNATSYAPPVDHDGWKHRFDAYYGDGFGNYWDLNCHQRHKAGHFFTRHHGHYYPDYQYPRFGHYGHHYVPFYTRHSGNPKGFYRCLNREGLSVECYKQHGRRG